MKRLKFLILILIMPSLIFPPNLYAGKERDGVPVRIAKAKLKDTSPLLGGHEPDPSIEEIMPIIGWGKAVQKPLAKGIPYMISKFPKVGNGIANAYLFAQLGGLVLAAEPVTMSLKYFIMGTAMGGFRASSVMPGQYEANEQIGNVNKIGLVTVIGYSAISIPLCLTADKILAGIGIVGNDKILDQLHDFFVGYSFGIPAVLALYSDQQFALGVDDHVIPLVYGTLYPALATLLAFPMVEGWEFIPAMGISGIGYASSIAAWATWIILRVHLGLSKKYREYELWNFKTLELKQLKSYLQFFGASSAMNLIILAQDLVYSQVVTGFGTDVAQAYASARAYVEHFNVGFWGFSSAIGALISNYAPTETRPLTEVIFKNCKKLSYSSVGAAMGVYGLCLLPMLIWKDTLINFFGGDDLDDHMLAVADKFLYITIGNAIVNSYAWSLESTLHGLIDLGPTLAIDIATVSIGVGTALIGYGVMDASPVELVASILIPSSIQAICMSVRWNAFFHGMSRTLQIDAGEQPEVEGCNGWTWRSAWGVLGIIPIVQKLVRKCRGERTVESV